jgi:ribonuclease HI
MIDIYFDGACLNVKGKDSEMGVGVIIEDTKSKKLIDSIVFSPTFLGTSNEAEWIGLLLSLDYIEERVLQRKNKYSDFQVFGDSQIIVNQFKSNWNINKDSFKVYFKSVEHLSKLIKVTWVKRERNKKADVLSKEALLISRQFFK